MQSELAKRAGDVSLKQILIEKEEQIQELLQEGGSHRSKVTRPDSLSKLWDGAYESFYTPLQLVEGGYTGITLSVCLSVRLSPFVRSFSRLSFNESFSNFVYFFVIMGDCAPVILVMII